MTSRIIRNATQAEPVAVPAEHAVTVDNLGYSPRLTQPFARLGAIAGIARKAYKAARGQQRRDFGHIIDIAEGRK